MRLINLLILSALILISCGKKTDPIPKSKLADLTPPAAVTYKVTDEGILIDNQEKDNLIIEKGIPEGEECTFYNRITMIGPKAVYVDKEVASDQRYFYRVSKQTVKYGLVSQPYVFSLTYEKPLKIKDARYLKTPTGYNVTMQTDDIFMRFDVYSGGKSIAQTGTNFTDILKEDVINNELSLVLTDYYGNKGNTFVIQIPVPKTVIIPNPVETVDVLSYAAVQRIAWSLSDNATSYNVEVCDDVSCETYTTQSTSIIYDKKIAPCINVAVTAVNADGMSAPKKYKYCKPIEE